MPTKITLKCPECGSTQYWKVGMVRTRHEVKQHYKCKKCARQFYAPKKGKRSRKGA